ncbi:DUF2726 domain-containing protein [Noviherbaspirillum cavernae]|uniref:DUF2726 domain-containing protein n=1 Tax=Noviherbaspirillum cavernae TaxID=2320862 RepID=A0A418X498_9BURK|nr:DUF2726 domain-containing protein [Noviherbaspirillum cavernae]RJG07270.1 DUF2726 domain-containing protein [Noviherbaspirillum cavernae]
MNDWMIAGGVGLGAALLWLAFHGGGKPRYKSKPVLTGGDLEFFHTLRNALPGCHVFPKVAMTALLEPTGLGRARQLAHERIAARRVGYAVFDEDMQLRAVVELSHRSGVSRKELARDEYLASAGIKTLRFHARQLPSEAIIEQVIFARSVRQLLHRDVSNTNARSSKMESRRQKTPWRNTASMNI